MEPWCAAATLCLAQPALRKNVPGSGAAGSSGPCIFQVVGPRGAPVSRAGDDGVWLEHRGANADGLIMV